MHSEPKMCAQGKMEGVSNMPSWWGVLKGEWQIVQEVGREGCEEGSGDLLHDSAFGGAGERDDEGWSSIKMAILGICTQKWMTVLNCRKYKYGAVFKYQ